MNRNQVKTRLTSIIDIRNEQIRRLKELARQVKDIAKLGNKAEKQVRGMDEDESVQELFPTSLMEGMQDHNGMPLTEAEIYEFMASDESNYAPVNVQKTLADVLAYAEAGGEEGDEEEEDDEDDEGEEGDEEGDEEYEEGDEDEDE